MSKKGENIFKRKDGRWEARYVKGYEPSGKIKYGFCYGKTYKDAKEKVTRRKVALLNPPPAVPAPSRRVAFFAEEWLHRQKSKVKESTYVKYDSVIHKHILPKLGGCFPHMLDPQTVEGFTEGLLGGGLSSGTVRNILMVLRAVLEHTARQLPGALPGVEVALPKETRREARVLSVEEERRFKAYLLEDVDACKFGVLLAMLTGLRIGELCALRWGNISIAQGTVRVEETMQRLRDTQAVGGSKTKVVIGAPKSDMSVRTIPLPACVIELCRKVEAHSLSAFLLTGTEDYMEPRTLQYRFKKYTRECGLEGVHFHTLRHTFATRCVEVNFELKSLSEILGHANTSITLNRYVHSSFELKRENMNKLEAFGF